MYTYNPPRRSPSAQKNDSGRYLRQGVEVLLGCLVMAVLSIVGIFVWTVIAYICKIPLEGGSNLSSIIIWTLAMAATSFLVTWSNRGGAVTPILILSLVISILSFLLMPAGTFKFFPALGKILFTMFVGVLSFTLTKLSIQHNKISTASLNTYNRRNYGQDYRQRRAAR